MTILYLHYWAIYPPQVVLQKETKKKRLFIDLEEKQLENVQFSVFPSAVMQSRKAAQKHKQSRIDPEHIEAHAASHA